MKRFLLLIPAMVALLLFSCKNNNENSKSNSVITSEKESPSSKNADDKESTTSKSIDDNTNELMDTTKLKGDMNDMLNSVISGKPDTTKLKKAAGDIMTTDANMLSDSGIDKMYGNSNDPSVKAAAAALKKMRNGMGITPGKLDSMRKEADALQH